MKLSVSHPDLIMVRFEIDHVVIEHKQQNLEYVISIDQTADIKIFFEPWKISPLIRIDGHLIDYWLANVMQYDHMIQFQWNSGFYYDYQHRNIESKIQYLGLTKQEDIDYHIGINNSNLDIVDQIKKHLE
jgi:hypothetical protein